MEDATRLLDQQSTIREPCCLVANDTAHSLLMPKLVLPKGLPQSLGYKFGRRRLNCSNA